MLRVKNVPKINEDLGGPGGRGASAAAKRLIAAQQREIVLLRQELAMHDALAGISQGKQRTFAPMPTISKQAILAKARQFLHGELDSSDAALQAPDSGPQTVFDLLPDLYSVRVIDAYFSAFLEIAQELPLAGTDGVQTSTSAVSTSRDRPDATGAVVVGEVVGDDGGGGFGLGVADDFVDVAPIAIDGTAGAGTALPVAAPKQTVEGSGTSAKNAHEVPNQEVSGTSNQAGAGATGNTNPVTKHEICASAEPVRAESEPATKPRAKEIPYAQWCKEDGKELVAALAKAKEEAKANKAKVREGAAALNESKRRIDALQAELENAIADTPQHGGGLTDAFQSDEEDSDTDTVPSKPAAKDSTALEPPHVKELRQKLRQEKAR